MAASVSRTWCLVFSVTASGSGRFSAPAMYPDTVFISGETSAWDLAFSDMWIPLSFGCGGARDCARIIQRGDAPAQLDDLFGLRRRQHVLREGPELGLEVGVAHRPLQRAERVLDVARKRAAARGADGNTRFRAPDRGVLAGGDAAAQRDDARIAHAGVRELRLSRRAVDDGRGDRVVNAELALEPGARRPVSGKPRHQRTHVELDCLNLVGGEIVLLADGETTVYRRVHYQPAGVGLVHIGEQLVAAAQALRDHLGVELPGQHIG